MLRSVRWERSQTDDYDFLVNHTDNDRTVMHASPGYVLPGERSAAGLLSAARRGGLHAAWMSDARNRT